MSFDFPTILVMATLLTGLIWAGMLFAIVITQGTGNAFIYFQF